MGRSSAPVPHRDPQRGTWWWRYDSTHRQPDGTRRRVMRRGYATRREAAEALAAALLADRASQPVGRAPTVAQLLAAHLDQLALAGRAPKTIDQYRWAGRRLTAQWGDRRADTLTAEEITAAYRTWLDTLSARSVAVLHGTLTAAYRLAATRGSVTRNPMDGVTYRPPPPGERPWWTPQQVGAFLTHAHTDPRLPVGLIDLLADTGCRRGEALAIRWDDLDLDAATVTIRQSVARDPDTGQLAARPTKRPRSRSVIDLHPATIDRLHARRAQQAQERLVMAADWPTDGVHAGRVFTRPDGLLVAPGALTRAVAAMARDAGLPHLTPHGLRHSFATAALSAGMPVELVAARLGNTPATVQATYQHVIRADDAKLARTVGDLYRASR